MKHMLTIGAVTLLTGALPAVAAAQANGNELDPGDVGLIVENNKIVTGLVENNQIVERRIFVADLFPFFGFPFTANPGFDTRLNTLPPFSVTRLNMTDALRMWNGADFNDIAALDTGSGPTPIRVEISFGSFAVLSPISPGTLVNGPSFAVTSLGDLHVHPQHLFQSNLPDGLYLLTFEVENNAGLTTSDPFWFIYEWNSEPGELAAASQWVQQNLIDGVEPIPGDLNNDNAVNGSDLLILLNDWGSTESDADINTDGIVDGTDLLLLLNNWTG